MAKKRVRRPTTKKSPNKLTVRQEIETAADRLQELFPETASDLREIAVRADRPLNLAVVGEFSAGKSTFINALVGAEVLPSGPLPTTGVVTTIQRGDAPGVVVSLEHGGRVNMELDALSELGTHVGSQSALANTIQKVDVYVKSDALSGLVVIDTPGLNAPNAADQEVTERVLDEADAILWVSACDQLLARSQQKVLKAFSGRYRHKSICVVSKVDLLRRPAHELPALLKHAKSQLGDYFNAVVPASAQKALDGDPEGMNAVRQALQEEAVPRQRAWVAQTARQDAQLALQVEMDVIRDLQEPVEALLQQYESKVVAKFDKEIVKLGRAAKKADDAFKKGLTTVIRSVASTLQKGLTTWNHYEPYTHTMEGWFTDDKEVRYHLHLCWEFTEHSIQQAFEQMDERFLRLLHSYVEETKEAQTACIAALQKHHRTWRNSDPESSQGLGIAESLDLDDPHEITEFIEQVMLGYWYGAMGHGGLPAMDLRLIAEKETKKPTQAGIRERMAQHCPLEEFKTYLPNHRDGIADFVSEDLVATRELIAEGIKQWMEGTKKAVATFREVQQSLDA